MDVAAASSYSQLLYTRGPPPPEIYIFSLFSLPVDYKRRKKRRCKAQFLAGRTRTGKEEEEDNSLSFG